MNSLSYYIKKFSSLRTASVKGEKASHKPILLLAVIEGIERKDIWENKIYITPELVAQFKDYWHQLVHSSKFTPNFSLPFYHLKSDGFWRLQTLLGKELILTSSHSIKSFAHLKEVVAYAFLEESLYKLMT